MFLLSDGKVYDQAMYKASLISITAILTSHCYTKGVNSASKVGNTVHVQRASAGTNAGLSRRQIPANGSFKQMN